MDASAAAYADLGFIAEYANTKWHARSREYVDDASSPEYATTAEHARSKEYATFAQDWYVPKTFTGCKILRPLK